ncbi:MAG: hypothetical protein KA375_01695 [Vitreoscilla sp.]|nr:hypothetical protein [Burkholderiales bacterium]MBP6336281.1 hypothetical protein [Vitreoscilla sp.]MBP6674595.1 hypothetical protein [Vitreoscilla sp.]
MRRLALWLSLCTLTAAWAAEPAPATPTVRDPTVPPLAARAPAPAASTSTDAADARSSAPGELPRHLMVLNGKPYVIERGWPRGVGDKLGDARIERIEGGSVWLRDASGTRKLSLYPGVEIRPSGAATAPDSSSPSRRTRRSGAPATSAHPASKDPSP